MAADPSNLDFLFLPGRDNSPPAHWQSHWLAAFPNSSRVLQADWSRPDATAWIARVDAAVMAAPRKVVLIGHSAGVATAVRWAAQADARRLAKIGGAFLAAPTNVDDPDPSFDLVRTFAPMPLGPLPFPALVAASRDDPRVSFEQARIFADAWGADFADVGAVGHIGSASGLGIWPLGLLLLGRLLARIEP